ncbi:MAG: ABC transporter ATP-binding protein [Dehalococcoidales bacterium]|jgi:lipooligosaccharide transport system ATP-binding protein|nr:ABC transporter ATP-binding protein [Dehalococcoidales bacterium]
MAIIKTKNLTKKFKDLLAVDSVSLEVEDGECFGLLGPNGAGKTSLIRMITAVSPPTQGEIWVMGNNLKTHSQQVKAFLGVVPQLDNLDQDLTVLQNLMTFARYFDIPKDEAHRRSMEVLSLFELESKRNSHLKELSGGMKRRLLLARGLINLPQIMILDEPTIGLDPQAKYLVWHKLTELKSQGVTQLLCTQNMEEATVLCDRVAIMHQGKILSLDTPRRLIAKYVGNEVWEIEVNSDERLRTVKELENRGLDFEEVGGKFQVFHIEDEKSVTGLVNSLGRLQRRQATLEDVFLRLTGRSLAE